MVQLTFFAEYTHVIKIDMGFRHDLVKLVRYKLGFLWSAKVSKSNTFAYFRSILLKIA